MTKTLNRAMEFDRAAMNAKSRTVPAVLSTSAPVSRDFGDEVLLHTPEAIDMTRAANGLPLLFSHDRSQIIGRVGSITIDKGKLRGLIRFSDNTQASEVWRDVEAGILTDLSIGYRIDAIEQDRIDAIEQDRTGNTWNATRWTPLEVSLVTVPADPHCGINRAESSTNQEQQMNNNEIPADTRAELNRRAEISDSTQCRPPMDDAYARRDSSENPATRTRLMAEVLASRFGGNAPSNEAREYSHMRLPDMIRSLMNARGHDTNRLSPTEIITRGLHTTGDFPELLLGTGNRIMQAAYQSYQGGVKRIARQTTIADFRAKSVVKLGEAPSLEKVNEHGEFSFGSMAESKASYKLETFGKIFGITRQALVNDDLDAFGTMIARFGVAAAELENKQLAALLTANANMSDGVALFHATHGNLAGTAAVINVTSLGLARKAMRLQTGLDAKTPIDCQPSYLIVPASLETVAEQFLATLSPTVATDSNPFSGRLELVVDPRLDASSATAWYLATKPNLVDTLEYAYLEGYPGPVCEVDQGWEVDGTQIKARLDFGCGVLDWRGLYKNAGA